MKERKSDPHIFKALKDAKITTIGSVVVFMLFIFGIGIASQTTVTFRQIGDLEQSWETFDNDANAKSILLSDFRKSLGYGGAIHDFKNFVLRRDRHLILRVHSSFRQIEYTLMRYAELDINQRELDALRVIDATFRKYNHAISLAEKMVSEGASTEDVDEVAKVDDKSAIDAMNLLAEEVKIQYQSSAA